MADTLLSSKPRRERKVPPRFQDDENWDINNSVCTTCFAGGNLLCCTGCTFVFHLDCLDPPLAAVPAGDWFCHFCEQRAGEPAAKRQRVTTVGDLTLHCPLCVRSFAMTSGFERHMVDKHNVKSTSAAAQAPADLPAATSPVAVAPPLAQPADEAAPAAAASEAAAPAETEAAAAAGAGAGAEGGAPSEAPATPSGPMVVWEEALSPDGIPYFYNRETKVSSWRRPEGPNVVVKPHKSKLLAATPAAATATTPGSGKPGSRTTPTGRDSRATSPTRAAALVAAKVYHCTPCNKSFISEPGLLQHMTKMHKDDGVAVPKLKGAAASPGADGAGAGKGKGGKAESASAAVVQQEIVASFKDCLKYMRPPTWSMSNADIDNLDVTGLRYFPLKQFLEQYSVQMDSFVKSRVEDAEMRVTEASAALAAVRGQCAALRTEVSVLRAQLSASGVAPAGVEAAEGAGDGAAPPAAQ